MIMLLACTGELLNKAWTELNLLLGLKKLVFYRPIKYSLPYWILRKDTCQFVFFYPCVRSISIVKNA